MQLVLYWKTIHNIPIACCESNGIIYEGVDLLSCLLMDDGGLSLDSTLEEINYGLEMIDLAAAPGVTKDWIREDWEATISKDETLVSSLADDKYSGSLSTSTFKRALSEWKKFVSTRVISEDKIVLEV